MTLTRCQDQKGQTLDEFYGELLQSTEKSSREMGQAMLALMASLRALPDPRQVYGLTSHHWLYLLASDTSDSPWFVMVIAADARDYRIEYLMPDEIAPWPHAHVRGEARSEDEAVSMIFADIDKSQGWSATDADPA